jgi:L-ascorbate metabolism protein UlaG (beta-lactamase superfamily)
MLRQLLAVITGLSLAMAVSAQEAKKLSIRWHGQSFFEIRTSAGTRIVIDPHAIENFGAKSLKADLILYTHFHTDHIQFHIVENLEKVKMLGGLKDEKGDRRYLSWNHLDEKFKDVHIRSIGTYHDEEGGLKRGLNSVLILEVDGYRIVHLGDVGHLLSNAQLKAIGPVDILMIPVGGVYTINGSEAKQVVEQLKPRYFILPMHCGTRVYEDLLSAEEFLDEQKNVKKNNTNELSIEVGMKQPAEPTIVVLHWSDR